MEIDWKDTADVRQGQIVHLRQRCDRIEAENTALREQSGRLRQAVREADAYFDRNGVPCDAVPVVDRIADCHSYGDLDPPPAETGARPGVGEGAGDG